MMPACRHVELPCYDKKFMMSINVIQENVLRIRERIARAAEATGRREDEITLVGVSKTRPAADIRDAFDAGVIHFGEIHMIRRQPRPAHFPSLSLSRPLTAPLLSSNTARMPACGIEFRR